MEPRISATLPGQHDATGIRAWVQRACRALLQRISREQYVVVLPDTLANLPTTTTYRHGLAVAAELQRRGWSQSLCRDARFPDEPFLWAYRSLGVEHGSSGRGADFFGETTALCRALSEHIERTLWYRVPVRSNIRHASVAEMRSTRFLHPETLAGFSHEQRAVFPLTSIDDADSFAWVRARKLGVMSRRTWVPLQLVSGAHFRAVCTTKPREKLLRHSSTSGLATSWVSTKEAIVRGILELIERDAFMIAYANKLRVPRISLDELHAHSTELTAALERCDRARLTTRFVSLPTDFPVHAVAAVILDESGVGPPLTIGLKAAFTIEEACEGSLREALGLRHERRAFLETNDSHENTTKPPWMDPAMISRLSFLTDNDESPAPEQSKNVPTTTDAQYASLARALDQLGYDAYAYEFAHPLGQSIHTVMVLVPDLIPLVPGEETALPYTSSPRFKSVPEAHGYTPRAGLYLEPHLLS